MRKQPSDLAIKHANELAASWNRDAQQLFGRETKRMFLVHRRDVVEPVEIRQRLQVGLVFDQLFSAAMEQTDMRVDAPYHLAVEFQYQAQDAVGCRVLRPKIDGEIAECSFGHMCLISLLFC